MMVSGAMEVDLKGAIPTPPESLPGAIQPSAPVPFQGKYGVVGSMALFSWSPHVIGSLPNACMQLPFPAMPEQGLYKSYGSGKFITELSRSNVLETRDYRRVRAAINPSNSS